MSLLSRWQPKGEIVARAVGGETVLVPVRNCVGDLNSVYTLDEVAAFIWELIGTRASAGQIIDSLTSEFDVAADQAQQDVIEFIGSLESAGLVEPCCEDG